jgi:hypothetical protein
MEKLLVEGKPKNLKTKWRVSKSRGGVPLGLMQEDLSSTATLGKV